MKHLRLWSDLATEEPALPKTWGCINPRKYKLNISQSSDSQTAPSASYLKNFQNISAKWAFLIEMYLQHFLILPFQSSLPPSRYKNTPESRQLPGWLPVAIGFARAFPSRRSFGACCVWNEPTQHLAKNSEGKIGRITRWSMDRHGKERGKCWAYSQNSTTALVMLVVFAKV